MNERFIEQWLFRKKNKEIDEKWTMNLRKVDIIFLNDWKKTEQKGSFMIDERTKWKKSKVIISTWNQLFNPIPAGGGVNLTRPLNYSLIFFWLTLSIVLKTDYFLLWFLYKMDLCISTAGKRLSFTFLIKFRIFSWKQMKQKRNKISQKCEMRKFCEYHEYYSCNNWLLKRTCGILNSGSSIFEVRISFIIIYLINVWWREFYFTSYLFKFMSVSPQYIRFSLKFRIFYFAKELRKWSEIVCETIFPLFWKP